MKKIIKILAVLMAMLMLVSMATACKSVNDDMDSFLTGETNINGDDDKGDGGDVNVDDEGDDPSDNTDNGKEDDKTPGKEDNNKPGKDDKEDNKKDPTGDNVNDEDQQKVVENYTGEVKYEADKNPLVAESKALNKGIGVSFDLDTTGFVKNNVKLKDLKGKTFIMLTAIDVPFFNYKDESGKTINEWDWWDALRNEYGLKVKYIKTKLSETVEKNLTYQSSGKQVDLVPTHRSYFPNWMNLSQPLDPYVNTKLIGNSPGVDLRTLEQTKWAGTYRCIAPIGAVDVIWYNQSMVEQLGLKDPHTTWKNGNWNWEAWKEFLVSVPSQGPTGKTLAPWSQAEHDSVCFWPQTAGVTIFDSDKNSKEPKLVNNFNDERVAKALTFYASTVKGVDFLNRRTSTDPWNEMHTKGTVIMMNTMYLCKDFSDNDFAKNQKFNWVPYPKSSDASGVDVAMSYGATMMLPRKMKVAKNAPYAVKFMELWANRFTEAIFDFQKAGHLQFNYAQRKEYYEFVSQNNYFGIGTNALGALTGDEKEYYNQLAWSMYNNNWNTATALEQLRNLAGKAAEDAVKYGT